MKSNPPRMGNSTWLPDMAARRLAFRLRWRAAWLVLVGLFLLSCTDKPNNAVHDAGDTETLDTDPYAVPEPTIEEPPPFAECEIEWMKTFELPDPDISGSVAMGMTQLANGNYLGVGGVFIPYDGNYGLVMEVAPDGEMLRYALLGQDINFYHRAFETEDGYMLFGSSIESGNYHCVMHLVSPDFEIIWDGGDEIFKCVDVERSEDGSFVFSGSADSGGVLGKIGTDYQLDFEIDYELPGAINEIALLGDHSVITANKYEDEYPYASTPYLLFASGLDITETITYEYPYSTGFGEIFSTGDGHLLLRGGSSFYHAAYVLYLAVEGQPVWAKYIGIENGPFVNNLTKEGEQYLFASGSADWKAYTGRLDEEGSILWHYLHDEPGEISVWGVMKDTNDSGIIVYGSYLLTEKWAWLMKIKSNQDCY